MLATATIVNNNQVTIILALRIPPSKVRYHSTFTMSLVAKRTFDDKSKGAKRLFKKARRHQ